MKKGNKTQAFPRVMVDKSLYRETMRVVETLDVPFAQIAREAIQKEIALLKQTHPKLQPQTALAIEG